MIDSPIILLGVIAALFVVVPTANANSHEGDRFSLSFGLFVTDLNTDTQLNGTIDTGTLTDLEKDLGLDPSGNFFRLDGYYRFNERHRIDFSVFDLSRSSSKQIERDIQWGDVTTVSICALTRWKD